ncbi:MAG: molybdopterin-binding protein [Anaerolineae bacterium]
MKLRTVSLEEAEGKILCHNIARPAGGKALKKGQIIGQEEIAALKKLGRETVLVVELERGDVPEDEAAARLGQAVASTGVQPGRPTAGKVTLLATHHGLLKVNVTALTQLNEIEGLAVATLHHNSLVEAKGRVATVKVIPFALPESALQQALSLCCGGQGLIRVTPLKKRRVGLILTGSPQAEERIVQTFEPAIVGRVADLGSEVTRVLYVGQDEGEIATALKGLVGTGVELIILAGETSVMARRDVTPRGIELAGGRIEEYGAPVDPGHLFLLAYLDEIPIIGAPGCTRSRKENVVDVVLPRLLAEERLRRQDIIALGHGGLLP